jgi:hypothetical protein
MEYFKLELDGNHFVESYFVYLIEVTHADYGRFFYVGQTGDRNHFTARPAFRRLSAHLSDQGWSKENQLYRHIAQKLLKHELVKNKVFEPETKTGVGAFLREAKICMHVFPVKTFDKAFEPEHKANRKYVESIENEVISQLLSRYGANSILNSRIPNGNREVSPECVEYAIRLINTACTDRV